MKILLLILLGIVCLIVITAFVVDIKWLIKTKRIENRCNEAYLWMKEKATKE